MNEYDMDTAEETTCPRCGLEALQTFADSQKQTVVIHCRDCGTFTLTESEYAIAESEMDTEDNENRENKAKS